MTAPWNPPRVVREMFCRHCGKRVRASTGELVVERAQRHARNCNALKRAEVAELSAETAP